MSHLLPSRRATLGLAVLVLLAALFAAAASAAGATVTVRPGDTLSGIAARSGTSVAALVRANGIGDPNHVTAGRRLVIPGSGGGSASGGGAAYRVRPGDSLSAIAARHGVSVAALAAANGVTDPNVVVAGRRLTIPSGGSGGGGGASSGGGSSYRVRPGDTLGGIAARYGTSTAALAARNGIGPPYVIAIGRVLRVPAGSAGAPAAPTSPAEVRGLIERHSARYGVDPALARAIAWQESGWNQSMRSGAGAIGVMQLMPGTARWLGRDVIGRHLDPHLLADNVEGGVAYLAWLSRHAGSTRRVIASYYQGLASLRARGPYDDTVAYVASVLALRGRV